MLTINLFLTIITYVARLCMYADSSNNTHFYNYIKVCTISYVAIHIPTTSSKILFKAVRFGAVLITPLHWYSFSSSLVVTNEIL